MRIALLLALLVWSNISIARDYIAFFGTPSIQHPIPNAAAACPTGGICVDSPYAWRIRIDSMVSGETIQGTINAAMLQHTEYSNAKGQRALFVVYKIEDEARQKLLGAQYWIAEYAPPRATYCLSQPAAHYGIPQGDAAPISTLASSGCYVQPYM